MLRQLLRRLAEPQEPQGWAAYEQIYGPGDELHMQQLEELGLAIPLDQSSLIARQGEDVLLERPAALLKEVTEREFRGGSQGISIPLGKGVRY